MQGVPLNVSLQCILGGFPRTLKYTHVCPRQTQSALKFTPGIRHVQNAPRVKYTHMQIYPLSTPKIHVQNAPRV